jgi:hypothetical protein
MSGNDRDEGKAKPLPNPISFAWSVARTSNGTSGKQSPPKNRAYLLLGRRRTRADCFIITVVLTVRPPELTVS